MAQGKPTGSVGEIPLESYNVADPELYRADSWPPYFEKLRQQAPVHRCRDSAYGPYWSVSTYDLINQVELNHKVFSNQAKFGGIQLQDIAPNMDRPSFVSMDPPEHTGRRRAVAPIANRSSLKDLTGLIRERTVKVLAALPRNEVFDWVDLVSTELTSMMLATMFDYPQEGRRDLIHWSDVATANLNAPNPLVKTEEERYTELERMADAFTPLWHERMNGGAGGEMGFDLITMLANNDATKNMDREEFIGTLFLLIVGGNDTTRNSMTGGLLALHNNPGEMEKLRSDPDLVPNMVQETIRFQTPVIHMRRTVLEDTALNGQQIAKGDKVALWYISGNFDDTVFEDPYEFQVDRTNARRHLSFGAGIHRCVGDGLAELQLRILWEEILAQDIRLEVLQQPERVYSNFIRSFATMPVKIIP
ncbi:MAG: cytochrome P450 [Rhodospirillaceae bacterium]|jgi:cytochrome P450|nr:cytochrome P450 [Rhodospirillaceae bacterium]MBT4688217.1 cytochrome P450 [Rhodospirillaceae bacterium]MBT5522506.1 cytochrome P450 [Rhodospirillaceae bacterium]MBT5877587.1 cytochrome P450 [Rhodospirillaceae bacterium]MBT6588998.1 cytochrome P450 [Rhodospirillaceae bacterium]